MARPAWEFWEWPREAFAKLKNSAASEALLALRCKGGDPGTGVFYTGVALCKPFGG